MTQANFKTILYDEHKKLGARVVPFGGWEMPVYYESVLAEHKTVREHVGIFDVSHMGEISVSGQSSFEFLQSLTTNDLSKLADGQGQYTAICNEAGGMIDDLILYRINKETYFLCVNASNTSRDFEWIKNHSTKYPNVSVINDSSKFGQIAVQGPSALPALLSLFPKDYHPTLEKLSYTHIVKLNFASHACYIARTGYTGEKGYELYLPNEVTIKAWRQLLELNGHLGIKPIGLGARDTLRLEACYLLYGNDMNEQVSPLEAGIAWAVKLEKEFIGKNQLIVHKKDGVRKKIVAFKMIDSAIPRSHMILLNKDLKDIGHVTSGSILPTLGGAGGLAFVDSSLTIGSEIFVDVRGKNKLAHIVEKPLYRGHTKD